MKSLVTSIALAAIALSMPGCTPPAGGYRQGTPVLTTQNPDDVQVRAAMFRYLMREHPKDRPAFLSLGPGTTGVWIDAPAIYGVTLADTGLKLLPASRANVPALGSRASVTDRNGGKPGVLYFVKILRWVDLDHAHVEGGRVDGPVPTSGLRCVVKRVSGDMWRIDEAEPW